MIVYFFIIRTLVYPVVFLLSNLRLRRFDCFDLIVLHFEVEQ